MKHDSEQCCSSFLQTQKVDNVDIIGNFVFSYISSFFPIAPIVKLEIKEYMRITFQGYRFYCIG